MRWLVGITDSMMNLSGLQEIVKDTGKPSVLKFSKVTKSQTLVSN